MEYLSFDHVSFDENLWAGIQRLDELIFDTRNAEGIRRELEKKAVFLILLAMDGDNVVGYKIGYEDRTCRFYSWLGGVYPEYRRRGVASELMRLQHRWCRSEGYQVIRTHTKNKWRDMLILDLRFGFNVIGTLTDELGETKIILDKNL